MKSSAPSDAKPLRFESASRTHPGHVRRVNEDRILDRSDACLWAVADGMGGHEGGGAAADLVVASLGNVCSSASGYLRLAEAKRQIERANAKLYGQIELNRVTSRSGATFVAMLAHEDHYACIWAGDSRAYLIRGGRLARITRDHSLVQQLIDQKVLTEKDRLRHPQANIVTKAIGAEAEIQPDQRFASIATGDVFLLCSDGLTACVSDDAIADILDEQDLSRAADALLAAALRVDAPDNVSFVLVRSQ